MADVIFTDRYGLPTDLNQTLWILMNVVHKCLITEIFLHFGDIYYTPFRQFLKFGIVDICTVKCYYLVVPVMTRSKHELVVSCRRSELHIAGNTFIGVYYRVYLDAAFLLSGLGVPANSLENTLENSVIVVESMILSRFIHSSVPLRRLSEEICTFTHGYIWIVWRHQK